MISTKFDAIVIGAGAAGDPLARALANAGKNTLLIERGPLGGTCTNHGCTPTKTIEASARIAHLSRIAERWGIHTENVTVDLLGVQKRKGQVVDEFRTSTADEFKRTPNLRLLHATARFDNAETLIVSEEGKPDAKVSAPIIVINTGTRPLLPPIEGLDRVNALTSDTLLELDMLPARLIVLGGNYIGLEMAQTFQRFGSSVTVVEGSKHILPQEDPDIADCLTETLKGEGVTFEFGAKAKQAEPHADGVEVTLEDGRKLTGTHLLVATGRTPNTDTLNLKAANVETDDAGFVKCGDDLSTTTPGIWAAGDVSGSEQFNHIAYDDYVILRAQLLGEKPRTRKGRIAPYVVYTDPPLGRVGLSETQAQEQKIHYRLISAPMTESAYASEQGEADGLIKLLIDDDDQLLGGAILGMHGDEAISLIQLAMYTKTPVTTLADIPFAHPTLADTLGGLFRKQVEGR